MSNLHKVLLALAVVLSFTAFGLAIRNPASRNSGSVTQGSEYHSTTTALAAIPNYTVLATSSGPSALGSVNITNATGASANGRFCLYDATSTNTNGLWATTTLACFATNVAVGSYHFDVIFRQGLLLEYNGTMGSTTISWR